MRLSQKMVAQLMKWFFGPRWHQTIVAKIENGQRAVRLDEALALCQIYGMDLDDLLAGRNLDMIRNAYSTADEAEGAVYVEHRILIEGPEDEPLVPIADLLAHAEKSLKSESTRDMLLLGERLREEYPNDEEAQALAWREVMRVRRGEHPEA